MEPMDTVRMFGCCHLTVQYLELCMGGWKGRGNHFMLTFAHMDASFSVSQADVVNTTHQCYFDVHISRLSPCILCSG